jgi:hypothetical protein
MIIWEKALVEGGWREHKAPKGEEKGLPRAGWVGQDRAGQWTKSSLGNQEGTMALSGIAEPASDNGFAWPGLPRDTC